MYAVIFAYTYMITTLPYTHTHSYHLDHTCTLPHSHTYSYVVTQTNTFTHTHTHTQA